MAMAAARLGSAAAIFLLAGPGSVLAEAPAQTTPSRDIDITYRADIANNPGTALLQRLRYSAALRRQRLDMPTSGHWLLLDYARGTLTLVHEPEHTAMTQPAAGAGGLPDPGPSQHWQRGARQSIAGTACTDWRLISGASEDAAYCLTDDGAVLRISRAGRVISEAIAVSYAPQPESVFAQPQGYATPPSQP